MPKKTIALITLATPVLAAGWAYWKLVSSEIGLMELFPDIDSDDVIAAHRKMLRDTLKGKLADVDTDDDEVMKHIFLSYVNNL